VKLVLSGITSGTPLTVSIVTSSPLAMVSTGFSSLKKAQWQVSGWNAGDDGS